MMVGVEAVVAVGAKALLVEDLRETTFFCVDKGVPAVSFELQFGHGDPAK